MLRQLFRIQTLFWLVVLLFSLATPSFALDTDIYQANAKQNCYILLDSSGSMGFGVYESNINYGAMFDYLLTLNDSPEGDFDDYVYDTVNNSSVFYNNHHLQNRIYLVPGKVGITVRADADGESILDNDGNLQLSSGDAADPEYLWYSSHMLDTYTDIDSNGNLVAANPMPDGKSQRLSVDNDGQILFDGQKLPESQDIEYRHQQFLYGGGVIEDGFGDLLNAPGYYFSGYTHDFDNWDIKDASGGEEYAYFFITGNWMNMQQVYNLHYIDNPGSFAAPGDPAWQFETYPFENAGDSWPTIDYDLDYPAGDLDYEPNIEHEDQIRHPNAGKIKVHFDLDQFDINPSGRDDNKRDWVIIQTEDGTEVARYNNDNLPPDGWSAEVEGDTALIILDSYRDEDVGSGFVVDQYAYNYSGGEYQMKNRLTIATSSILNTIEHFRGQINWGTFTFPVANGSDGATSHQVINPNLNDDENRENIASDFKNVTAEGGTPIGEALQEVFEVGYYQHRNSIDNLVCRRNYAIVLSDGFPSTDDNWGMIGDITGDPHLPFEDWDGDGFTADPYQYTTPPANFYDDVAHWMYTHSWLDKTEVSDPANSYVNVSSHQISFGFQNPLMQDAADEAGGLYITAYNEGQLNAAFYAIGLAIAEAVSFTAPVVSVDAANKIQNGDDLYMGQFIPMDASYWPGNLKKFKLGNGSVLRPEAWQIYDAGTTIGDNLATNDSGEFFEPEKLEGYWHAADPDYGGLPIHHDGVGEVLTDRVTDALSSNPYGRVIKTTIGSSLVSFDRTLATSDTAVDLDDLDAALGTDVVSRNKIINWIHGYTFDADVATGNPVAARDWALGAIIHSRPTVIDYYDPDDYTVITKRLIAVGADDGMLHVFYDDMSGEDQTTGTIDEDGSEVFAYIPTTVLPQLKGFETEFHIPLVDGLVKLYREKDDNGLLQPKYLFCGLRRGGRSYVRVTVSDPDPANWTVDELSFGELGQSWSDISFAKIRTAHGATAENSYTTVAIFSGGYDDMEDDFPEPFNDLDNNGTPYADNGQIDGGEWDKNDAEQDVYAVDNDYTLTNPDGNNHGRGIFIVNIDTLASVFSVTYGDNNLPTTQNSFATTTAQTRNDMIYCFPATPSVVSLSEDFQSLDTDGTTITSRSDNVLTAIYSPDIYGNLFRIVYDYDNGSPKWQVAKLFSVNPASSSESSEVRNGDDTSDIGRKVFYGPAISWRGSGRYHDPSNYNFTGYTFDGIQTIASVFFGTGDRVHPTYRVIKNRVYALYDDIPVTANNGSSDYAISSAPYTEDDLLNITCDELGVHTLQRGLTISETWTFKSGLQNLLTDDVTNAGSIEYPDGGADENDAKGWYIILEDQGSTTYCDHCDYEATVDDSEGGRDYHVGEKVLSKFTLFAGNLYFTTYQPAYDDPCAPEGNAFAYALNYLDGSAGLNLNYANDDHSGEGPPVRKDVTDRYGKYSGVKGIPSGFEVVVRGGEAGAMASLGSGIIGGGEDGEFEIPHEDSGISLYYWIEQ